MTATAQAARLLATVATANATLVKGKHNPVDATSGALTMTLPTGVTVGSIVSVEKVDASVNAVTISGTIRGVADTLALTSLSQTVDLIAESSTSWRPLADHRTRTALDSIANARVGVLGPAVGVRSQSLATLGDSIGVNGGVPMHSVTLAAAANVGDTSISITPPLGSGSTPAAQVNADFVNGYLIQVGSEFTTITATPSVSGAGPYTISVHALTAAHASGARVVTHPIQQANNSPTATWWACLASDGKLRWAGTYGHGGYTTNELLSIYLPLVIQAHPGYCYVMAGRNRNPAGLAATIADILAIWDALIGAGIMPIGSTLPPSDAASTSVKGDDEVLNMRLKIAAAKRGIPLTDLRAQMVDTATGNYVTGYSPDGIHPSNVQRRTQGQGIWTALSPYMSNTLGYLAATNVRSSTTLYPRQSSQDNALFLNSGGLNANTAGGPSATTSATVPAGIQVDLNDAKGVVSMPAAPRGVGKSIHYVRTANVSGAHLIGIQTAAYYATLVAGHWYRAVARIKTVGLDAATAADAGSTVELGFVAPSNVQLYFGYFAPISYDMDGTIVWDFYVPSITLLPSTAKFQAVCNGGAATPSYTVDIWGVDLSDLTVAGDTTDFPFIYS